MSDVTWEPIDATWYDPTGEHKEITSSDGGRKLTLYIPRALMDLAGNQEGLEVELSMDAARLCRQVEVPAKPAAVMTPGVPDEVREAIGVCANYGIPLGITYAEYNAARDAVTAWLAEMEANSGNNSNSTR